MFSWQETRICEWAASHKNGCSANAHALIGPRALAACLMLRLGLFIACVCSRWQKCKEPFTCLGIEPGPPAYKPNTLLRRYESRLVLQVSTSVIYTYTQLHVNSKCLEHGVVRSPAVCISVKLPLSMSWNKHNKFGISYLSGSFLFRMQVPYESTLIYLCSILT